MEDNVPEFQCQNTSRLDGRCSEGWHLWLVVDSGVKSAMKSGGFGKVTCCQYWPRYQVYPLSCNLRWARFKLRFLIDWVVVLLPKTRPRPNCDLPPWSSFVGWQLKFKSEEPTSPASMARLEPSLLVPCNQIKTKGTAMNTKYNQEVRNKCMERPGIGTRLSSKAQKKCTASSFWE